MLVGSLVEKGGMTCVNRGLVLKRITGVTFDEVLVIWLNPSWTSHNVSKKWETPNDIRVISR